MAFDPVRPFTPQQMKIADCIDRELSYKEIGEQLELSEHTVRQYVRDMAVLLDEPRELPPRWRIFMWIRIKKGKWEERAPDNGAKRSTDR